MVLLPKTYEVKSSKALPVLEAIRLAWDRIKPCRFYLLWVVQPEITIWLQEMLSEEIRQSCVVMERIPRAQVLELMVQARVMLAPSLSDGIPNSMLEAMACGAFPVVSPLGTITPVVEDGQHVLFARNLYPQEIATALERAMTDDRLVDQAARKNLELVKKIANRDLVRSRVLAFYQDLCRRKP
jgi:glycosyltransferase involved in cell wall biosynthesis